MLRSRVDLTGGRPDINGGPEKTTRGNWSLARALLWYRRGGGGSKSDTWGAVRFLWEVVYRHSRFVDTLASQWRVNASRATCTICQRLLKLLLLPLLAFGFSRMLNDDVSGVAGLTPLASEVLFTRLKCKHQLRCLQQQLVAKMTWRAEGRKELWWVESL